VVDGESGEEKDGLR